MKSYQQLFAELKRRNVFKVAAVYGATAFVLLQAADVLGQGLRLPESFLPFVTALVLLGFPLALIVAWAFELTPQGLQRTESAAPGEIDSIVAEPASKRWPAGLMALFGVVALVAGAWWVGRQGAPEPGSAGADAPTVRLASGDPAEDPRPSIAVFPFADMSPEGDQEYFSDGMSEELLNALAKVRELKVTARTSAFAFKGHDLTAEQLGDTLRVRYLVEGSVRKAGDRLRITAQLIDTSDGSHLWSEQYDREMNDVFAIQTEIAEAIAQELRVPLGLDEGEQLVSATADLEAYDLYLAGRARLRERGSSMPEAIRLFEAAVARDSTWAPAWAGLAEATEIALWYPDPAAGPPDSVQIAEGLAAAERAALRALELDPRNASAYVALGNVLRDRFQWRKAEARYFEALVLDPDNAEAHQQYAELLYSSGRVGEAVRAAARAVALDPAPVKFNILGVALVLDNRPEQAIRAYELGIAADPEGKLTALPGNLGRVYYDAGRYDLAGDLWRPVDDLDAAAEFDVRWPEWVSWMRTGDVAAFPDSAREFIQPEDWMRLGIPDTAAVAISTPPAEDLAISFLSRVWDPIFDPVRDHPAVQAYLRDRGLAGVAIQRTPPEEREPPSVLRERGVAAAPSSEASGAGPAP